MFLIAIEVSNFKILNTFQEELFSHQLHILIYIYINRDTYECSYKVRHQERPSLLGIWQILDSWSSCNVIIFFNSLCSVRMMTRMS